MRSGASALSPSDSYYDGEGRKANLWSLVPSEAFFEDARGAVLRLLKPILEAGMEEKRDHAIGAGRYGRGAAGKTLVVIAVGDKRMEGIGRIRLQRVVDASAQSLIAAVRTAMAAGSTVRTDDWGGYGSLGAAGYAHIVAREAAEPGDSPLPLVHRVASVLKRWLLGTHRGAVCATHLDYYPDEYTFRFNRSTPALGAGSSAASSSRWLPSPLRSARRFGAAQSCEPQRVGATGRAHLYKTLDATRDIPAD